MYKRIETKAFTLAELLIVFIIIGFFMVITIVSTSKSIDINEKRIILSSQAFYNTFNEIYNNIMDIDIIRDNRRVSNLTSENLRDYILNYVDGVAMECNFKNLDSVSKNQTVACAKLTSGIQFAAFFDNTCKTTVKAAEYAKKDEVIDTRTVKEACGYIAYRTKKSNEVFKHDFFSIALGRHFVR